jgi:hypothetical protein
VSGTADNPSSLHEAPRPESCIPPGEAVHSASPEILAAAASDPALNEELALTLLQRPDLSADIFARLSKNGRALNSRKVKVALIKHPKAPRHVAIPLLRHLFTFDLMRVALTPTVPADVKIVADKTLINRLESIPSGERLWLAKRGSGRIAAELLLDPEPRVIQTALTNPRLTEAGVIRALAQSTTPPALVEAVCHSSSWSVRREVRIALLRNADTRLACALEFARSLPENQLTEILHSSRLPENVKACLLKDFAERSEASLGKSSTQQVGP